MTKQELRPDQEPVVQPPAEQAKEVKKEPTVAEEVKEAYRKLEKAKNILHAAGDIEVGQTPHEVLEETRAYRLFHYQQMVTKTAKTPILVVYALINRSYVLDLQSDKSWIRSLLSQGFDVYLLDWKPPTAADKYVSFDDHVNCYIDDCVNTVLKKTRADKLTLHGYCMGATMSTMYTTLHQEKVRNLAVIAPVVDTEKDTTVIGNLAKNMDVNKMVNILGNLPAEQLYACYSALKPFKQGVNKYFNLVQNIDNDQFVGNFLRIEKWLYDTPPIAGETFRQWIADIYQKNLFVKNELKLGSELIDLSKIKVPLLNIVADEDHLVSPQCSAPLNDVVLSTDKRLMRFHTGHVGLIASLYSQNNVLPKVGQWLKARSQ
ncbi:MAG TPA: class III poly(R)-hydroxyalkanoic acid synthase subunit PhaC [Nitrososphaera sp.]|nr:class III poly(R)-hydroxyalkanoic acid synthase subunit PhaC [Nitrososphaera sp.]